jgi:hypothetical protein
MFSVIDRIEFVKFFENFQEIFSPLPNWNEKTDDSCERPDVWKATRYWLVTKKKRCLHRLDGPAVIWEDGEQSWYQFGRLHREDGPAVECANGYKAWYQNGELHRVDGPAVEYFRGDALILEYWVEGTRKVTGTIC